MLAEKVGLRVRELRKKVGLTQAELAEKVGIVEESSISSIERGRRLPSLQLLEKMSKTLGVETHEFFNFTGVTFQTKRPRPELLDVLLELDRRSLRDVRKVKKFIKELL